MNTFGSAFKIEIFGESHGKVIGIVLDGVPAGLSISPDDFTEDMGRRHVGGQGTTARREEDRVNILSGVFNGYTTGTPLALIVYNQQADSAVYDKQVDTPRPGHADYTAKIKYGGFQDYRGGGHFSGRVTVALIMAGVVAKKMIAPVSAKSYILNVGGENPWEEKLAAAIEAGDSLGGVVECTVNGLPAGVGEPFFNSLESLISHIIFSIPGIRGIEFGDGFQVACMMGSEHNDPIISADGATSKNGSGGINGGISNGNDIVFRVAIKPTSSISASQRSYNFRSNTIEEMRTEGRHDTCFALRTPVIIEAAATIAIADLLYPASTPSINPCIHL